MNFGVLIASAAISILAVPLVVHAQGIPGELSMVGRRTSENA
jgi:hypothetical protein